jgi:hypothetical protein
MSSTKWEVSVTTQLFVPDKVSGTHEKIILRFGASRLEI